MSWRSLSFKINVALVIVLVVVLGGSALFTISAQNVQAVENTKTQARILSRTLTNIIRIDMEGRCQKDVMKIIRMMGQFQDIETLRIFNSDGVIMHSGETGEIGTEVDEIAYNVYQSADRSKPFRSGEGAYRSFCMVDVMYNEPSCHTCHDSEREIIGVLEVCLSMAKTERQIDQNARFMILSTLVTVLLVTGAISLSLFFMVNRPVKALVATMHQVQDGNLEVRVAPSSGDELGILGRSFDAMISQLDETSTEVARLHREQMTRAERLASIGEMAASVAHEIKNPLAGLAGATQVLSKSFGPEDSRYPVVQEMLKLTGRLDKTICDLLSFARESEPKWVVANLNDVAEETLFFIRREEARGGDGVTLELDPDMPEIPMDPQQIQQVLLNLIINARQAVGPGGRVTVSTAAVAHQAPAVEGGATPFVEVCVRDDGPGISPEEQTAIFKPFFTTKNHGTGLGLPISRKIIEAHGGVLHLESTPGNGAAFFVWLRRERTA